MKSLAEGAGELPSDDSHTVVQFGANRFQLPDFRRQVGNTLQAPLVGADDGIPDDPPSYNRAGSFQ